MVSEGINGKILVTGAAGFIGMHSALRLSAEGYEVTGLDNLNTYYSVELKLARLREQGIETNSIQYGTEVSGNENLSFVQLDICDDHNLEMLFEKKQFDIVVHLAAQAGVRYSIENPHAYIDSNVKGFLNVLEACRKFGLPKLIYASSSSVYGQNEKVPFEENDITDRPVSLYAATKKADELIAHSYGKVHGLAVLGLRFFTVYGPWGRPDMALFKFTEKILKGEAIELYNNGELARDFTYIDDITEGIFKVIEKLQKDQFQELGVYNIGRGKPVELMDFVQALTDAIKIEPKIKNLPMQKGDVYRTNASTRKLLEFASYSPRVTIKKGVKLFVDWYMEHYKMNTRLKTFDKE